VKLARENSQYDPSFRHLYEIMYPDKQDATYIAEDILSITTGAVIELGCGMGRVLLALAKAFPGRPFVGLDALEYPLTVCLENAREEATLFQALNAGRLRFVLGDMCEMDSCLPATEQFGAVVLCNSTVLNIQQQQEREALLAGIKNRLAPGGLFFLEYTDAFWESWDWTEKQIEHPVFRLYRKNDYDAETQVAKRYFRFERRDGSEPSRTMHVTVYHLDYEWLKGAIRVAHLRLIHESDRYPGEEKGKRRILVIGHQD
jgi:SAM-dependent methyltransferase